MREWFLSSPDATKLSRANTRVACVALALINRMRTNCVLWQSGYDSALPSAAPTSPLHSIYCLALNNPWLYWPASSPVPAHSHTRLTNALKPPTPSHLVVVVDNTAQPRAVTRATRSQKSVNIITAIAWCMQGSLHQPPGTPGKAPCQPTV